MPNRIQIVVAPLLLSLAFLTAGCGSSGSEDGGSGHVRVGLEAPLSGEQSVLGEGMLRGAELAATRLNAKNGILGRQVEIVPIDEAADPATRVKAARSAIA